MTSYYFCIDKLIHNTKKYYFCDLKLDKKDNAKIKLETKKNM